METADKYHQESRRLADLLSRLVRLSGRNVRAIERELGVSNGALGKVLHGTVRLQVDHILMIVDVLGITPAQFFQRAYSREERMKPLGQEFQESAPLTAEEEDEEAQQRAEKLVRRVLHDLLGKVLSETKPTRKRPASQEPEEEE